MTDRSRVLDVVTERITGLPRGHPVRVGIDGVDAAGKTTFADDLSGLVEAAGRSVLRASIDGFHRPAAARYARGETSGEGYFRDSFDHATLRRVLLDPLGPGGNRRFRRAVFDERRDRPVSAPTETAHEDSVLLFDGVFLHRPELAGAWELTIFLDVPFEIAVARAVRRDLDRFGGAEAVERRSLRRYVPGQRIYLQACRPQDLASILIDHADPERPVIVRGGGSPRAPQGASS